MRVVSLNMGSRQHRLRRLPICECPPADKDLFSEFYRKKLARRLLHATSGGQGRRAEQLGGREGLRRVQLGTALERCLLLRCSSWLPLTAACWPGPCRSHLLQLARTTRRAC